MMDLNVEEIVSVAGSGTDLQKLILHRG